MEQLHRARRSASHDSIGRTFALHGSIQPFPRRLRSVNENATLLSSPGPLESMLKTTTETGDIGIFTIGPVHLPAAKHISPQLRPKIGNGSSGSSSQDRAENGSAADEGRRLPPHRDMASEIISMYGSDSQRSVSSSLSPPFDDAGHRSYSITSCSSRPLPHQKSSGTLKSHSSGSYMQRPRSPFPYPTRLKRPGVRPSSPALTENGGIDYSRMVEIDRVSYVGAFFLPAFSPGADTCKRTVHGSYRPTYAQGRRLHSVIGRRDRSGHSTTGVKTTAGSSASYRDGVSNSGAWHCSSRGDWEDIPSDSTLETWSLASFVDMYRSSACLPPSPKSPAEPSSAFYYDYSEHFDAVPIRHSGPTMNSGPLVPVPTRAPSMDRPMVLNESCEARLRRPSTTSDVTLTAIMEKSPSRLSCDDIGEAREDTGSEGSPIKCREGHALEIPIARPSDYYEPCNDLSHVGTERVRSGSSISPASQCQPIPNGVDEVCRGVIVGSDPSKALCLDASQSAINHMDELELPVDFSPSCTSRDNQDSKDDDPSLLTSSLRCVSQPLALQGLEPLGFTKGDSRDSNTFTFSGRLRRSKFYTIEPGLSDLASLMIQIDKAAKSSHTNDNESSCNIPPAEAAGQVHTVASQPPCGLDGTGEGESLKAQARKPDILDPDSKARCHRRNVAALKIDTHLLEMPAAKVAEESGPPILAPKPRSPARKLKWKQSEPQLMKALPPLPGEPAMDEWCIPDTASEEIIVFPLQAEPVDFLDLARPAKPAKPLTPQSVHGDLQLTEGEQKHCGTETVPQHEAWTVQSERYEAVDLGVADVIVLGDGLKLVPDPSRIKGNGKGKGKLKLKVSRGALARVQQSPGPVRRKLSSALLKTPRSAPLLAAVATTEDSFNPSTNMDEPALASLGRSKGLTSMTTQSEQMSTCSKKKPVYLPSLDDGDANTPTPDLNRHISASSIRSRNKVTHSVKRRVSRLSARLGESRYRSTEPLVPDGVCETKLECISTGPAGPLTSHQPFRTDETTVPVDLSNSVSDGTPKVQARGLRSRMFRWMKTAKQAISAWARKKARFNATSQ